MSRKDNEEAEFILLLLLFIAAAIAMHYLFEFEPIEPVDYRKQSYQEFK